MAPCLSRTRCCPKQLTSRRIKHQKCQTQTASGIFILQLSTLYPQKRRSYKLRQASNYARQLSQASVSPYCIAKKSVPICGPQNPLSIDYVDLRLPPAIPIESRLSLIDSVDLRFVLISVNSLTKICTNLCNLRTPKNAGDQSYLFSLIFLKNLDAKIKSFKALLSLWKISSLVPSQCFLPL